MDDLLLRLLSYLHFFASGLGVLTIGVLATLIFVLWNWRAALVGLLGVQLGVIGLVTQVHGLSVGWASIQVITIGLCGLLLGLSARQFHWQTAQRPGSWVFRSLTLILLVVSWRLFNLHIVVPVILPQVTQLFVWLALCALVTLSLGDTPFFTGIALLLWCIPIQAAMEIILPGHGLAVLIGILQILTTLACSYMILVEYTPATQESSIPTDITFPLQRTAPAVTPGHERERVPAQRPLGTTTNHRPVALPKDATGEYSLTARRSQ